MKNATNALNTANVTELIIYSTENPAFRTYLLCSSFLAIKMMLTTLLVIYHRLKTKTFISPEDGFDRAKGTDNSNSNEDVERVRRAYQNDMENIFLFLIIGLAYLSIQPPLWAVNTLFFLYLITRTFHTIVYAVYVVRQPARALLFQIGFIIIGYMATHTAVYAICTF